MRCALPQSERVTACSRAPQQSRWRAYWSCPAAAPAAAIPSRTAGSARDVERKQPTAGHACRWPLACGRWAASGGHRLPVGSRLRSVSADTDAQAPQLRRSRCQPLDLVVERPEPLQFQLVWVPARAWTRDMRSISEACVCGAAWAAALTTASRIGIGAAAPDAFQAVQRNDSGSHGLAACIAFL